jgi:cell division septal protein FtsQ
VRVLHLFWLFLFLVVVWFKSLKILAKSLKKIVVKKLENLCEDLKLKGVEKMC